MKTQLLWSLFITVIISSCKKDKVSSTDEYDIIVCAGQSNTHYGEDGPNVQVEINPNVFQLGRFGNENYQIIPASEPLHHHTINDNGVGFATTFANLYLNYYTKRNTSVLIIPVAKSGSAFIKSDWNKGDELYQDAITRIKFVLSEYPNSQLKAFLWHQGESDIGNTQYQKELDQFISDFRNDLHANNVPFILGGMVPYWVNQSEERIVIQEIIKDTPHRHKKVGYVDPENPFTITKEIKDVNPIHYDAKNMIELAKRYFKVYQKLTE